MRGIVFILPLLLLEAQAQSRGPAGLIPVFKGQAIDRCSNYIMGILQERISPAHQLKAQALSISHEKYMNKYQAFYQRFELREKDAVHLFELNTSTPMPENFKELIVLSDKLEGLQKSTAQAAQISGVAASIEKVNIQFGTHFPHDYSLKAAEEFVVAIKQGEGRILVLLDAAQAKVVKGKPFGPASYEAVHYHQHAVKIFDMELERAFTPKEYTAFIKNKKNINNLLGDLKHLNAVVLHVLDSQRYTRILSQGNEIMQRHQKFWDSWKKLLTSPSYKDFSVAFKESQILLQDTEHFLQTTRSSINYLNEMPLPFIPGKSRGQVRAEISKRVAAYSVVLEDIELMNRALQQVHNLSAKGIEKAEPLLQKSREVAQDVAKKYKHARHLAADIQDKIGRARKWVGRPRKYMEEATETLPAGYYLKRFTDFTSEAESFSKVKFYQEVKEREKTILHSESHFTDAIEWADSVLPTLGRQVMILHPGHHPVLNAGIESLLSKDSLTLMEFLDIWNRGTQDERNQLLHKLYLALGDDGDLLQNAQDVMALASKNPALDQASLGFYRYWNRMEEYERKLFLLSLLSL